MKLSIVTGNQKKYGQIVSSLPDICIPTQVDLDLPEIQTNLLTDISADKAVQAWAEIGGAVLVDDSGIYFDAYTQFPGALTKFLYTGVGLEGMQRMYTGVENMSATFQTVLSYMDDTLTQPLSFIGEIKGTLTFDYLGQADEHPKLPYDLIFIPEYSDRPAIFDMEKWVEDNHRTRAVREFGKRVLERVSVE